MNKTITPQLKTGEVYIPSSKSEMHRLLICAALGSYPVEIDLNGLSKDITATADCLNALGAKITTSDNHISLIPVDRNFIADLKAKGETAVLKCGESGSTLRFMLPVAGMLGVNACFVMEGRLSQRPLDPLDSQLKAHGMELIKDGEMLYTKGQLSGGAYTLPGNISSQYISGLLMALPFLPEDSSLEVTGKVESQAYIAMTEDCLFQSGIELGKDGFNYKIPGGQQGSLKGSIQAQGDYSNAAFFLCMGALSKGGVKVKGLLKNSTQGDRAVIDILKRYGAEVDVNEDYVTVRRNKLNAITIDAAPIPDLIPVLSVVASVAEGTTTVINAGRLRIKESDRLESTAALIRNLGGNVEVLPEGLIIHGQPGLKGGTVDSVNDHRIAMSAAVAACVCTGPVEVLGAQCVAKSYPHFWEDYEALKADN